MIASALPALAEEIRYPDDWLSTSLTAQSVVKSTQNLTLGATRGVVTEVISVTPLDDVKLDAVGVLPASIAGLPLDFWGDSRTRVLARLLHQHPAISLPAATELLHRILMAELPVPAGHTNDGDMLIARVDHLLAAGALDQAEALLARAGTPKAALFRRWFDVGLLAGRAQESCAAMLADPGLAPALQARVFCLARSGDWAAAVITLTSAVSLGQIDPNQEALLARFLDPDLFEGEPDPPAPDRLTPLVFTMREALGIPRQGQALPLAFLQADLRNYEGWRNRLMAAERLMRSGALAPQSLLDAYSEAQAAASGGIWDRVRAVADLKQALQDKDSAAVSKTLPVAYTALANARLEIALATLVQPSLIEFDLTGPAREAQFHLALLTKDRSELAPKFATGSQLDQLLVSLATDTAPDHRATDEMQLAIQTAIFGTPSQSNLLDMVNAGRMGEAVLKALLMLQDTGLSDPHAAETALGVLARAGLREEARIIAIQMLVLNHRAVI